MKELKTGNIVDFISIDEFTGKEVKLTGKILGDYIEVQKQYPIECSEAPEDTFLVKVAGRSGFFAVGAEEVVSTYKGIRRFK